MHILYDPATLFLGINSTEMHTCVLKLMLNVFIAVLFTIAKS
jgi:hypothetical protein